MSYSGTVRCSYCGQSKHNRSGCDKLKDYIAANPASHHALVAADRQQRKKDRPRCCSYCQVAGHTRRTCATLVDDRAILALKLSTSRKETLEKMAELGVGIGTLVNIKLDYYTRSKSIAMIIRIPWSKVNSLDAFILRAQFVKEGSQRGARFDLRHNVPGDAYYGNPILQVVSPIDALDVIASAPSEWSDGSLYEEDTYFPKGEARKGWLLDDDAS